MAGDVAKREIKITDKVLGRVNRLTQNGQLVLPQGYSAPNALNSAWLILQSTRDSNKRPVLDTCTQHSIANALLTMVIEGLNPMKNQVYFIAYGDELSAQRSYFGDMMLAQRVNPNVRDITYAVIYEGDKVRTRKEQGRTIIVEHEQDFANIDNNKIIGAYCTILFADGTEDTTIMTMDQIRKCWNKSKTYKRSKNPTPHDETPDQMAQRTVIRRACKKVIQASDDSSLVARVACEMDMKSAAAERNQAIHDHTNVIDVDFEEAPAPAPESLPELESVHQDTEPIQVAPAESRPEPEPPVLFDEETDVPAVEVPF